jgi:trans-aconitate 2-methyltransferase
MSDWDPGQYLRFAAARLQPAIDLLARVPLDSPQHVYDLGCGTGTATRLLRERWPEAGMAGVDSSPAMLRQAAEQLPGIDWIQKDLRAWQPPVPADLIYSNAALHWLPDHGPLFRRLMSYLAPGGVLAVQMPNNFAAPSHRLLAETIQAGAWRGQLEPLMRGTPVHPMAFYYGVLEPLAASIELWETEYLHILRGKDPVKEWTKGSWLKPFLDALDAAEQVLFEDDYAERLRHAYPASTGGATLFPFKRLFLVAKRRG